MVKNFLNLNKDLNL